MIYPQLVFPFGKRPIVGGGGGGGPTWDSSAKSSLVSLSNFSLTATSTTVTEQNNNVLSTTSHASGKYYFEITATTLAGTDAESAGIGIADSGFVITTDYVGSSAHSLGYYADGHVLVNATQVVGSPIATYAQGDVIGVTLDIPNSGIWFQINAVGNWNNNGSADPTTNTGGLSAGLTEFTKFVAAEIEETTEAFTVNFAGPFPAAPSGFGLW